MNIKQLFSLIGLLALASSTCQSMQQQQQKTQDPQQKQQEPDRDHKSDQGNGDSDAPAKDDTLNDLNSILQTLVDKANSTYGSVDNMIKQKTTEHPRICPTCGRLAANCPADQGRIRNGNIMTCGCSMCGGRQY